MKLVTTKLRDTLSFEEAAYVAVPLAAAFFGQKSVDGSPSTSLVFIKNADNTVTTETVVVFDVDTEEGARLLEAFKDQAQGCADNGFKVTIEEDGETTTYSSVIAN